MTGRIAPPTVHRAGVLCMGLTLVACTGLFLLLAYVDARLQRGRWSWEIDGWMVAVAAAVAVSLIAAGVALGRARYGLAWIFVLLPALVAAASFGTTLV